MEELTLEECRGYLKRFKEICVCQACLGPLRSPEIVVCIHGHAVCTNCKVRAPKSCPVCRNLYRKEKPTTLCKMIDVLPRFCRFNYGCNRILRDQDDHESWCQFRHLQCLYCTMSMECQSLLHHLSDTHQYQPHNMLDTDFQKCDFEFMGLNINVGVMKLLGGHMFNIHYIYIGHEKRIIIYVTLWPIKRMEKDIFLFNCECFSMDDKISLNFSREMRVKPNIKNMIWSLSDTTMEGFNGKTVGFRTMIFDTEEVKIKAESSQSENLDLSQSETLDLSLKP